MPMKIPCEVVVKDILPMIRKELSVILVKEYGLPQSTVARRLDITDAAVSQYLRSKRGSSIDCSVYPQYEGLMEELRKSAEIIFSDGDVFSELCCLCEYVKRSGLLAEVYKSQTGFMPRCTEPDD